MSYIIKIVLLFLLASSFSFSQGSSQLTEEFKLKKELLTIQNKIKNILIRQKEGLAILSSFDKKEKEYIKLLETFKLNKEKCQKLEASCRLNYNKSNKNKDLKLIQQEKNVVECYEKLERAIYKYDNIEYRTFKIE